MMHNTGRPQQAWKLERGVFVEVLSEVKEDLCRHNMTQPLYYEINKSLECLLFLLLIWHDPRCKSKTLASTDGMALA